MFGPSPVRLVDLARVFIKRFCIDLRIRCAFHRQEFGMRPLEENVTGSFRVHHLNSLYSVNCPSDDLPVLRKCLYITQTNHCGLSIRRSLMGGCKQTAFHLLLGVCAFVLISSLFRLNYFTHHLAETSNRTPTLLALYVDWVHIYVVPNLTSSLQFHVLPSILLSHQPTAMYCYHFILRFSVA